MIANMILVHIKEDGTAGRRFRHILRVTTPPRQGGYITVDNPFNMMDENGPERIRCWVDELEIENV